MISRNTRAHGHAIEATGVLVQLRQQRIQYVSIEPAAGAKCNFLGYSITGFKKNIETPNWRAQLT